MADPKLKLGNDIWATKQKSLLAYNDEGGNYKSIPFQVDRISGGTYVGRNGLIQSAASNEPRIDFTSNTKGGLLLEPQRTNNQTYSEQFDNSAYFKYNSVSVTANAIIAPNGTLTADKIISDGSQSLVMRSFGKGTIGSANTFSVWAKKGNFDKLKIDLADTGGQTFTLTDKWQRVSITTTPSNSNADFEMPNASNGDFIYLWGAQIEVGTYATSYIPTSSAAVTRVQDEVANGGNEFIYNLTEGTLFFDVEVFRPINDSQRVISLSNGNTNNRILVIPKDTENTMRYFFSFNNSTSESTLGFTYNTRQKIAIAYGSGNIKIYRNGIQQDSYSDGTTFSDLDRVNFSDVDTTETATAKFYDVKYFDKKLSDSELATLTTL